MEDHGTGSQDRTIRPKRFSLTERGKLVNQGENRTHIAALLQLLWLTFAISVCHSR